MGISLSQPSFASGELAPSLWARTDLAKYQTGLRLCRNFYVMPYGGIKNRPGTVFINSSKADGAARLIQFEFNDEQTYALEFGNLYMRVIKNGGHVESSPGVPYEIVTPYTADELTSINFTQSADVLTIVHPNHAPRNLSRLAHDNWTLAIIDFVPGISAPTGLAYTGGGTGSLDSSYKVTAVLDSESLEESLPSSKVTKNNHSALSADNSIALTWTAVAGARYYNVYKNDNSSGIYGFLGRAETTSFKDRGTISPAKTDTPPNAENPFVGAGNYPGAVGYYQQRQTFAGSDLSPQTVWMSKTGNFKNFGYATPVKGDDAITFTIASRQVHRYRHLLPLRQLIGLTTGGEWVIQGSESGVTPTTIKAEIQSYNGCSKVPPIVINDSAIYVQARGNLVRSISYSFEADGFSGDDLTKFSPHLFRGHQIVDWCFQQSPDRLVWAVRDDGLLLGMTFLPEEKLVAWHQHQTDGAVESVCAISEGEEEAVYLVVRRVINGVTKRYIERMASRRIEDIEDAFFVDSGLTYDGRNTDASKTLTLSSVVSGTAWHAPATHTLQAAGHAPFSIGLVGRTYRLRSGSDSVRVEVVGYTDADTVTVRLIELCPEALRGVAVDDWALMATTISGLGHLEGKTISILTDGDEHPQRTVSSGSVTLQYPAAVVHLGLPYTADVETLDVDIAGQETLLDKRKVIPKVRLYVEESRGFFAGSDADNLYEQKPSARDTYSGSGETQTGLTELSISTGWSESGRVFIRQEAPLPLSILAVIPDVAISGKG